MVLGHFFWWGSGPPAVHLSPPENLKIFNPEPIRPLFDLERTKKFCAKIASVTSKSTVFFHEKNRLGKCAIFSYAYTSRELAVKFFDLAFLVPMGLGHMHIVVWHPNSCICTCPEPIRASNNNNPCTRMRVFIRCFFSLYKPLVFICVDFFTQTPVLYLHVSWSWRAAVDVCSCLACQWMHLHMSETCRDEKRQVEKFNG